MNIETRSLHPVSLFCYCAGTLLFTLFALLAVPWRDMKSYLDSGQPRTLTEAYYTRSPDIQTARLMPFPVSCKDGYYHFDSSCPKLANSGDGNGEGMARDLALKNGFLPCAICGHRH